MPNPIKTKARVENVIAHGEGVYTVEMRAERHLPRFKAGQFLHLTVDDYDPAGGFWPESRVFSIASSPGGDKVSIVYSVKGVYTRKMESQNQIRDEFVVEDALWRVHYKIQCTRRARYRARRGRHRDLPFYPFLDERLKDDSARSKVVLYYGARLRSYILFPELLALCAAKSGLAGASL